MPELGTGRRASYTFAAPYLDGVYLAVNAIPSARMVYDAHDCGYHKDEKIAANHDLFSSLLRGGRAARIVRTRLDSKEYVMGGADKLSARILQTYKRGRPEILFIARSNLILVSGADIQPVIDDMRTKLDVPIVLIPNRSLDADHLTGYLDAVEALLEKVVFQPCPKGEESVALAGYVFDRNEGDHTGNIQELKRLLEGIGARPGPIFLSGASFHELSRRPAPSAVVDLAQGWTGARRLAERLQAPYLATPLPMGIEGSAAWLRAVAGLLGQPERAEAFIARELGELAPMLEWLLPRYFFGKCALLFADRQVLPPLTAFLEELGCEVTGTVDTSVSFAGEEGRQARLEGERRQLPEEIRDLKEAVGRAKERGEADLIIGNSLVHQILKDLRLPFLEFGYPSNRRHALRPSPYLGFQGVRVLVEQMINAMEQAGLDS